MSPELRVAQRRKASESGDDDRHGRIVRRGPHGGCFSRVLPASTRATRTEHQRCEAHTQTTPSCDHDFSMTPKMELRFRDSKSLTARRCAQSSERGSHPSVRKPLPRYASGLRGESIGAVRCKSCDPSLVGASPGRLRGDRCGRSRLGAPVRLHRIRHPDSRPIALRTISAGGRERSVGEIAVLPQFASSEVRPFTRGRPAFLRESSRGIRHPASGIRLATSAATIIPSLLPIVIGVVFGAVLVRWRASRPGSRIKLARSLRGIADLLPRTVGERRTWVLVAITAGVTEELIYRGFVLSVLAHVSPSADTFTLLIIGGVISGLPIRTRASWASC